MSDIGKRIEDCWRGEGEQKGYGLQKRRMRAECPKCAHPSNRMNGRLYTTASREMARIADTNCGRSNSTKRTTFFVELSEEAARSKSDNGKRRLQSAALGHTIPGLRSRTGSCGAKIPSKVTVTALVTSRPSILSAV